MKAKLLLEDGTMFIGQAIGKVEGSCIGEVVFNTKMTGCQEVLTDPSSVGQIVTMTYPLIGNAGNIKDSTNKPYVKGLIVRELCDCPSNIYPLNEYLKKHNILGLKGIDTRALTRLLRDKGTMNGIITTDLNLGIKDCLEELRKYRIIHPVNKVTSKEIRHYKGEGYRISLIDYGVKSNIIHSLNKRNCDVYVFPATSTAEEILSINPDGIVLSNGPGDPKQCTFQIEVIKDLLGKRPIFGLCLGHQLIALANGGDTKKLKHGHRGDNYPVKDIVRDRTYITSQNHGYVVLAEKLDPTMSVISHINMNDNTVEGVRYLNTPTFTIQFHPESFSGPMETGYLFDEFVTVIEKFKSC